MNAGPDGHKITDLRDAGRPGVLPFLLLLRAVRAAMNALLHRTHYRNPSLLGLAEYRELEKQVEQRAACSREGALLEYETLELRVNPPNIIVENREDEPCTHVAIDSANRPGTLVEVSSVCQRPLLTGLSRFCGPTNPFYVVPGHASEAGRLAPGVYLHKQFFPCRRLSSTSRNWAWTSGKLGFPRTEDGL